MLNTNYRIPTQTFPQQKITFRGEEKKTGKNIYPAAASLVVSGSGQMLNGEYAKGITILAASSGLGLTLNTLSDSITNTLKSLKADPKATLTKLQQSTLTKKSIGIYLALAASMGLAIYSAVDAYRFKGEDKNNARNAVPSAISYFIPGAGQVLNGEIKKGLAMAASAIALAAGQIKALYTGKPKLGGVFGAATTGLYIYSAIDAYRGPKNKPQK